MSKNAADRSEPDDLVFAVSHDLRANLRHITAYTALVREELPADAKAELTHYLNTVTAAALNLGQQLDALAAFIHADQAALNSKPLDLRSLALEVFESFKPKMGDRQIVLQMPDEFPTVLADPALLRNILSKLIGNAVKFTQKTMQAEIQIGWVPSSDTHKGLFFIKDNGVGFDPRFQSKLFRLFQRLHSTSEFEGLGLGLALTRKWVARHGGRVWAEAMPGDGCKVSFELPLVQASSKFT
jgi:two-component system, OmpR family, sensor kinase